MSDDCPTCHQPSRQVAVRISMTPGQPVEVERICDTWGCRDRLVPRLEEAMDPEQVVRGVLRVQGWLVPA